MIRTLPLLATLIALTVAPWPSPGAAQIICDDRDKMIEKLRDQFSEVQIWAGLADGRIFELWVACPDGSWTMLRTSPRGIACMVAAGEGWRGEPCKDGGAPA